MPEEVPENNDSTSEKVPKGIAAAIKRLSTFEISALKKYLTTGLFVMLPFFAAIWVIFKIVGWISVLFVDPFFQILETWVPEIKPVLSLQLLVGIVAVLLVAVLLIALGLLASNVAGRWFLGLVDSFFRSVPLANTVYNFVKNLIESFNIAGGGQFEEVVAIEYPRQNIWSVGFISNKVEGSIKTSLKGDRMAVFVPTGPNPATGFIVLVEPGDIVHLDIPPEEALKFIVSCGVLMPGTAGNKKSKPGESSERE